MQGVTACCQGKERTGHSEYVDFVRAAVVVEMEMNIIQLCMYLIDVTYVHSCRLQ